MGFWNMFGGKESEAGSTPVAPEETSAAETSMDEAESTDAAPEQEVESADSSTGDTTEEAATSSEGEVEGQE